jgi:hypothetical protein
MNTQTAYFVKDKSTKQTLLSTLIKSRAILNCDTTVEYIEERVTTYTTIVY